MLDFSMIAVALAFAAFLALALERVYEAAWASWFKPFVAWLVAVYLKPHVPGANSDKVGAWATMAGSMIAGVVLAYSFGIDLLSPLAVAAGLQGNFYAGFALTGLAIGGGANLFHAIFGIYEQGKAARKAEAAWSLRVAEEDAEPLAPVVYPPLPIVTHDRYAGLLPPDGAPNA